MPMKLLTMSTLELGLCCIYALIYLSKCDDTLSEQNLSLAEINYRKDGKLISGGIEYYNSTYSNDSLVYKVDWKEETENANVTRRLTGSRYAHFSDYPYVASVQKVKNNHWCTGTIITERVVITTADCMLNIHNVNGPLVNDQVWVRVGSGNPSYGGHLVGVSEIARHPEWGVAESPKHNLALLVLDKHLQFSDSMHSVELPKMCQEPPFHDAWVTGWGVTTQDGIWTTSKTQLRVYHATLMPRSNCSIYTNQTGIPLDKHYICMSQKYSRAPCTRDVGAPAVSDGVLWGIASWANRVPCGSENFPGIFEYLAAPSNWNWLMKMGKELTARAPKADVVGSA